MTTVTGACGPQRVHSASKAAMVPALQGSVVRHWKELAAPSRGVLLGATTAALVGDLLLVAPAAGDSPEDSRRRLQRGAMAFGVQQVGYLALLRLVGARPRWRSSLPIAAVLAGLASLDTAKQSAPDPIVTTYGVLLGAMAAHAAESADQRIRLGGIVFLASDAMILLREQVLKEGSNAAIAAGLFVMATYAVAQRSLIDGFIERLAPR
ncbi:lysoplasmalogenase family protein [Demetria terragena]|uniref:lysoplasmalogenase family protein n=1 Tax=Demetria terragena TaxID=63959 RepID=UPI0012EADD63|nr:lysoplasmalogenase family protein [Demetria terragena]